MSDEFDWTRKLKCWVPDRGETEESASLCFGTDVQSVATNYAEHFAGFSGDPFDCLTVRVRAEDNTVWDVEVEVVAEPVFTAHTAKIIEGNL